MQLKWAKFKDEYALCQKVAKDISNGSIVGWFQGASEFGPRALGNRSILADPRNPEIKNIINEKIKHREWWRPYAPVVIEEKRHRWFDLDQHVSPYMLFSAKVKNDLIPGVTHEDGSARVQTVCKSDNSMLHLLLFCFDKITGVPVLLNTSFNDNGEPIVETPMDAIRTFKKIPLNGLVMGNYYVKKS